MADPETSITPPPPSLGGFLLPAGPLSPAPSATSTTTTTTTTTSTTTTTTATPGRLPHPRAHPLRPGSAKEDKLRRYIDDRLLHINRRYVKKFGLADPDDDVVGYASLADMCRDLEALVNMIWLSGTPSLQVPYLLLLAGDLNEWLVHFPPATTATLALLRKLDHCFASLLAGWDIDSREVLPGFENGVERAGLTTTDMVRCRSMVEETRRLVVEVVSRGEVEEGEVEEEEAEEQEGAEIGLWDEDEDRLHMDVARVYENTLMQLGARMGEGGGVGAVARVP